MPISTKSMRFWAVPSMEKPFSQHISLSVLLRSEAGSEHCSSGAGRGPSSPPPVRGGTRALCLWCGAGPKLSSSGAGRHPSSPPPARGGDRALLLRCRAGPELSTSGARRAIGFIFVLRELGYILYFGVLRLQNPAQLALRAIENTIIATPSST